MGLSLVMRFIKKLQCEGWYLKRAILRYSLTIKYKLNIIQKGDLIFFLSLGMGMPSNNVISI